MESIFGDGSLATSATWKPEPITRGTYTILSTCLITLGLCVWTAVHLNIPGRYERRMDVTPHDKWKFWAFWFLITCMWPRKYVGWPAQTFRKLGWTILGFLTPEVVAFTAYRHYKEAVALTRQLQETFSGTDVEDGRPGIRNQWTLTHSFFVVMGGVEVALEDQAANLLPQRWMRGESRDSLVLTATGFRLLAEKHPHLVQGLSLQMIQDKSKGGAFAKTLVCFQALWFCVQCLTRLGQHLGISLLELNTFGHAVCALGIYVLWWHKPLDIQEPFTIQIPLGPEAETIAIMCMTSILDGSEPEIASVYPRLLHTSGDQDPPNLHLGVSSFVIPARERPEYQDDFDFGLLWHIRGAIPSDTIAESSSTPPALRIEALPHLLGLSRASPLPDSRMIDLVIPLPLHGASDQETECQRLSFRPPLPALPSPPPGIHKYHNNKPGSLTEFYTLDIPHGDLRRYALAAAHVDEWTQPSGPDHIPHRKPRPEYQNSLADRIPNLPRLQPIRTDWMFYLGFGAVGFLYGGLHCLAWNAPFQTSVEQTLWRVSSVTLAATGVLLVHLYTWELSRPVIGFGQKLGDVGKNLKQFHSGFLYKHLPDWLYSQPPHENEDRGSDINNFKYIQKWDATALVILPLVALLTIVRVAYDLLVCCFIVLYIAARVFLVIECFINLTHLQESAYLLPQWSQYVPHIG